MNYISYLNMWTYMFPMLRMVHLTKKQDGSLGSRGPTCNDLDHAIDSAQWMYLQFRLISIPTSDPQTGPLKGVVCVVLSVGKCHNIDYSFWIIYMQCFL